ncbi:MULTISPECIES: MFS transporter [Streptomyces]|uniref:MFS transporter n=1 Tax=Streptomyces TaxID=1883 RepID=UPI0019947D42|nr:MULTISPECIES: MFS transporter [Streptomyces]MCC2274683.1 MFS transporter [Streptomyces sp. ET3-23]GHF29058.1 MFS transporter [Streptomyces morookaense]
MSLSLTRPKAPEVQPARARTFGPRHRWTILGIGIASQAAFSAAFQGIPTTSTAMRSAYHLTNGSLGIVLAAISLGIAVSEIAWGIWTDRFGERRILLTGLITTGIVLGVMALAVVPTASGVPAIGMLAGGLLLVGALGGSVNGSSGRAVMAWFKDGQRGLAMSLRQTAIPAGGAIGSALLPWLAVGFGFRAVYGILALFCFAAAVATHRWMHSPEEPAAAPGAAAAAADTSQVSPLKDRNVWRLALASGLLTIPQFAILTFIGVFLHDAHHAALAVGASAVVIVQVGGAAARVASGRWTDKHAGSRRPYVRAVGLAATVALAAAAALTHGPTWAVVAALVVSGILANAWHGVAYTEIAHMAGAQRAGTALGLENTTVFAAGFLAPLMVPVLAGASWSLVWIVCAVATLLAVPLAPGRK